MKTNPTVDVMIPTYKPDEKFERLMKRLNKQTIKPNHIFIINTQEEYFVGNKYIDNEQCSVIHINKEEFDHGGTRNYGAMLSKADYILFITQDAVPADEHLIERLLEPFRDEKVAVSYARQLPIGKAGVIETYNRTFNYPKEDSVKSKKDLDRLGIKTYFCSNVCAVYRKDVYEELGGFVTKTIFNEDMIMAAAVIGAGYSIAYTAKAEVVHSHKYNYRQQFTRNFDLAVSQKQYHKIFGHIKSETEGIKLVKDTMKYLLRKKKAYLIPDLIMQSGFKYLGYKMGSRYDRLPKTLVKKFSMNQSFWYKE